MRTDIQEEARLRYLRNHATARARLARRAKRLVLKEITKIPSHFHPKKRERLEKEVRRKAQLAWEHAMNLRTYA
jgi:hypothetical protein